MPHPLEIPNGFYNLAKKKLGLDNPEVESLALERLSICSTCTYAKADNLMCGKCGCYLEAKIRSKRANCPLNRW